MSEYRDDFRESVSDFAVDFCEDREDTEECLTEIEDLLTDSPTPEPEAPPEPAEPPENPSMPAVATVDHSPGMDIESAINDCFSKSRILGISRPNEHACARVFEHQQRKLEEQSAQIAQIQSLLGGSIE